ncbi:hypothetical protein HK405_009347 [Cladochytrium tenue]|nr:hypothetical protein HK405_009347 [Cladochytrium tenue]
MLLGAWLRDLIAAATAVAGTALLLLSPRAMVGAQPQMAQNRVATLATTAAAAGAGGWPTLPFRADGTFRIVMFSDLHYGEGQDTTWGPEQDANSTRVMEAVLDAEAPVDLVVLTGDQVTGENVVSANVSRYVAQLLAPAVARGVPVASIYGNHDHAGGRWFTAADLLAAEKDVAGTLSLTQAGDVAGVGNYVLLVGGDSDGSGANGSDSGASPFVLWFFDSHGNASNASSPDWVQASQVSWFNATSAQLSVDGLSGPGLAFFHIPVAAARTDNERADFATACAGGFRDEPGAIAVQDGDAGFAAALGGDGVDYGDGGRVIATFSGHDHGTGWCCEGPPSGSGASAGLERVQMCFAKHSGYGGYGTWDRGARVVTLYKSDPATGSGNTSLTTLARWSTWIRMENASVVYNMTFASL